MLRDLHVRLNELEVDKIDLLALKEGLTRSAWIRRALHGVVPQRPAAQFQVMVGLSDREWAHLKKLCLECNMTQSDMVRLAIQQALLRVSK